ncbi:centromere protein S [Lepisosteus oculatus]|uniref:Centromere protein S n=1 Tax=Lepisosteus oculatus TaxID=7918 RepID=W5MHY6_LEPOC|nr:PREDICTED: centromere protein S [Lepisosteus oculatus]
MNDEAEQSRFMQTQRLRAAVHYTVGLLCREVGEQSDVQFSRQSIAALAETTFRQGDTFAKDLEAFARHAKRTTVNAEDVKLLARRSTALHKYITRRSEELMSSNQQQQKDKRKKSAGKGKKGSAAPAEDVVAGSEDSNMG